MLTLIFSILLSSLAQAALPLDRNPDPGAYVNVDGGPLLPLLKNAREKIDIEIYTMGDTKVRALLREAIKRGVKVRIVKEPRPIGQRCDLFGLSQKPGSDSGTDSADCSDQKKLVAEVNGAGGSFVPFNKAALCPNGGGSNGDGCFEHGKIALVDGLALMSTGNFDDTNLCNVSEIPRSCDRDYSLIISDAVIVDTLQHIFDADIAGARFDVKSLIPDALAGTLTVSPISLPPIVALLEGARESVELEAQYLKDPELNAALIRAAQRGVKVSLTVASVCSFGRPSQLEAKDVTDIYSAFDRAGIASRMFTSSSLVNGRPGYMHAKVIVVDGARAWVGSVNGSTESLTQNREYGLIFDKPADVKTVLDSASADHLSSGSESWQESLECTKDGAGKSVGLPIKKPNSKKPTLS